MKQLWSHSKQFVQSRFFYLLVSIVALLFIGPYLQERAVANWLVGLTSVLILGAVINSVRDKTRYLKSFFFLASLTLICTLLDVLWQHNTVHLISLSLFCSFMIASVFTLYNQVFHADAVTTDVLYGSVCVYLLIAIMYGALYFLIESFTPGSFHHTMPWENDQFTNHQLYYYSFVTISTLGYGDIIPVSVLAKSIVMMESTTGIFYIAILVARLTTSHLNK